MRIIFEHYLRKTINFYFYVTNTFKQMTMKWASWKVVLCVFFFGAFEFFFHGRGGSWLLRTLENIYHYIACATSPAF